MITSCCWHLVWLALQGHVSVVPVVVKVWITVLGILFSMAADIYEMFYPQKGNLMQILDTRQEWKHVSM